MSEQNSDTPRTFKDKRRASAKKRMLVWALLVVLLVGVAAFGLKPAYHWLKAGRAEQLAAQGDSLAQSGKPNEAVEKYRAALQLDPLGYRPLEAAAQFATRRNRPEAIELWEQVVRLPQVTTTDKQDYATVLIRSGRMRAAEKIISELLKSNPDARTLDLAARYSSKSGDEDKALEFAQLAAKRAPDDDAARFELANVLAASHDDAQRGEARKTLWALAEKEGPFRQAAIEALARSPELSREEQERTVQALAKLPSSAVNGLLASDLQLQLSPEKAEQIYEDASVRWSRGETADLIELARWLNLHKQSERVLRLVPEERALSNEQLLLTRMDAMANSARWDEIDKLLTRPDLSLDPSVAESFRARTAQERGSTLDADVHWNHAISLAGVDPFKLRFIANFAEQSHANDVALRCYDQMARLPGHAAFAYRAIQRLAEQSGNTVAARSVAEKISAMAPDDPNAQDQLAYLDLLLGRNVESNAAIAQKLASQYPMRLSFRVTAALACLRKEDAGSALAQFKGPPIQWNRTPLAWRAVYAAVLAANDQTAAAREIAITIPVEQLNRDERALIAPLTGSQ